MEEMTSSSRRRSPSRLDGDGQTLDSTSRRGARFAVARGLAGRRVARFLRNPLSVILVSATLALRAWPPGRRESPHHRGDSTLRAADGSPHRRSPRRLDHRGGTPVARDGRPAGRPDRPRRDRGARSPCRSEAGETGDLGDRRARRLLRSREGCCKSSPTSSATRSSSRRRRVDQDPGRASRERGVVSSSPDTGPGIPEDQLPVCSTRFWQAKRTARPRHRAGPHDRKGDHRGAGRADRGREPLGVGSTFFFTLPRASAASSAPEANGGDRPEPRSPDLGPK